MRLKVVVEIPGSWFGSGAAGSLNAGERAEKYQAQAAEFAKETVFSGVGGMVQKAITLGSDLTESYTICHHNWLYEFLEPSDDEIVEAYLKLNRPEPHDSDADESSSDEALDDGGEGDGEGEEMQNE